MASDHERIWLQSYEDPHEGRLWCQDNVWAEGEATEYVRADLARTFDEGDVDHYADKVITAANTAGPTLMLEQHDAIRQALAALQSGDKS